MLGGGHAVRDGRGQRCRQTHLPSEFGGIVSRELSREPQRAQQEQRERDLPQEDPVRETAREQTAGPGPIMLDASETSWTAR